MILQSIKSCYGGKNNWVSRYLSCLGFFAKFLIPIGLISYFIFPIWLFLITILLIVVLLVLGLSLVIVVSRIAVERVEEDREIKTRESQKAVVDKRNKLEQDIKNVSKYNQELSDSLFWDDGSGSPTYSDYPKFLNTDLSNYKFTEKINFIEAILRYYWIEPLLVDVATPDASDYVTSIISIKDHILSDRLEEAKQVRIRWNENYMSSQKDN